MAVGVSAGRRAARSTALAYALFIVSLALLLLASSACKSRSRDSGLGNPAPTPGAQPSDPGSGPGQSPTAVDSIPTAPKSDEARETLRHLRNTGSVLIRHHQAASAVIALTPDATSAECTRALAALDAGGTPQEVLDALPTVRDDVLRELLLGEHAAELALFRVCGRGHTAVASALLNDLQGLHQQVTERLKALEAAS